MYGMVFGTTLPFRRVVSSLCVPTHMYLAYKIAHNAGIMMPGKCTSARALEFVPKILYLHPFVSSRGLKWPVNGKRGIARDTSRSIFIRLRHVTNATLIYTHYVIAQDERIYSRKRRWDTLLLLPRNSRSSVVSTVMVNDLSTIFSSLFLRKPISSIILHAWYSNFREIHRRSARTGIMVWLYFS